MNKTANGLVTTKVVYPYVITYVTGNIYSNRVILHIFAFVHNELNNTLLDWTYITTMDCLHIWPVSMYYGI